MMRSAMILACTLTLTACAPTWGRPGSTDAEFTREAAYCRMVAGGSAGPAYAPPATYPQSYGTTDQAWAAVSNNLNTASTSWFALAARAQMFNDCMISRGWVQE